MPTVSLNNFIFPMNDILCDYNESYNEHELAKCQKPALATHHQRMQAHTQNGKWR